MSADLINGLFEFGGSLLIWVSVRRTIQSRGYAGIYWPATAFFAIWGFWNLAYYPSLEQWWSLAGGISIVIANTTWVGLMVWFGPLPPQEPEPWTAEDDEYFRSGTRYPGQ